LILVIGGTRGTGLLIAKLLDRGGFPVRVLARDAARAADRLGPRVQLVAGDITKEETIPPAVEATSHIVFTAGGRVLVPLQNQFWGDRIAWIMDPAGHVWTVATRIEETTAQARTDRWSATLADRADA